MSLKAIEMQIALPRTYDAGKIHEQQEQRGQITIDHAAHQMDKEVEKKRETVYKGEHKANVNNEDHGRNGTYQEQQRDRKKQTQKINKKEKHPFKGTVIDYGG